MPLLCLLSVHGGVLCRRVHICQLKVASAIIQASGYRSKNNGGIVKQIVPVLEGVPTKIGYNESGGGIMPMLELSDEQVLNLVKQLPPARQRTALLALAAGAGERRAQRMAYAEVQLRRICTERGLEWDRMSEDEREAFINNLVHEDRGCAK
jgi:hypothetical protein